MIKTNALFRFSNFDLKTFLLSLPVILIALTVHEVSHGFVAMKLGDPTARNLGRLTLNPLKHLDPIGTICMVLFHFGWAKPVPINTRYFKKPRRDMALTALAGPVSNFIMGFGGLLIYRILLAVFTAIYSEKTGDFSVKVMGTTLEFFGMFATLNVSLAVFNLFPVPPLDGSRIFLTFLPAKYYFGVMKYERFIMIGFLVILYTGVLSGVLSTLVGWVIQGMDFVIGLIPGL